MLCVSARSAASRNLALEYLGWRARSGAKEVGHLRHLPISFEVRAGDQGQCCERKDHDNLIVRFILSAPSCEVSTLMSGLVDSKPVL